MYSTNSFYGNATVLAAYAELDEPLFPRTIPGYLQPWLEEEAPTGGARTTVPAFIWGPAARIRRHRRGMRHHTLIGAPWLYLLELEKRDRIPQQPVLEEDLPVSPVRGQTLYFPHHGLAGEHAARQRAHAIAEQGTEGVTIALTHEQASSKDVVSIYRASGAQVLDLGPASEPIGSMEPFYLQRLLLLMRAHRNVRTDVPGVFALFAHAAGLPTTCSIGRKQLTRLSKSELGTEFLVPPQELRALFDWSTHV